MPHPKLGDGFEAYSKFANLSVVHSENLSLFTSTEMKSRDKIHNEEDDAGSTKGIGKPGERIGKLVPKLDIVMIEPTARDDGKSI